MSSRKCCLCSKIIESETADILTMGGYGIPRYLCEECAGDLNTVTRGATSADIHAAMDRLGKKMSVSSFLSSSSFISLPFTLYTYSGNSSQM